MTVWLAKLLMSASSVHLVLISAFSVHILRVNWEKQRHLQRTFVNMFASCFLLTFFNFTFEKLAVKT